MEPAKFEERPAPANWAASLKTTLNQDDLKKSEEMNDKNFTLNAPRWGLNPHAKPFMPALEVGRVSPVKRGREDFTPASFYAPQRKQRIRGAVDSETPADEMSLCGSMYSQAISSIGFVPSVPETKTLNIERRGTLAFDPITHEGSCFDHIVASFARCFCRVWPYFLSPIAFFVRLPALL